MDFPNHVSTLTQWYCRLVNEPGFREYTLDRVRYMAERQPMYQPLLEAVLAADRSRSSTPSSRTSPARSNP